MIVIRPVSPFDVEAICHHRAEMFREAGRDESDLDAMAAPFRHWLEPRLADGRYFSFMAEQTGVVIGGVGLVEIDWPPHPAYPAEARRGYVLNVFVEPAHRGQGVARLLMQASDEEFLGRGITYAILHATEAGRPLYERIGWAQTSEIAKVFRA